MAVTMADIAKLRQMTGAGMMDCKNALTEGEGDFDKAIEIIRKKGQLVAAKRSDREASEAEAKEMAKQQAAVEKPSNGGLFANAKISADALKKLTETDE